VGQGAAGDRSELEAQRGGAAIADQRTVARLPRRNERLTLRKLQNIEGVAVRLCALAGTGSDDRVVGSRCREGRGRRGRLQGTDRVLEGRQRGAEDAIGGQLRLEARLLIVEQRERLLLDTHEALDDAVDVEVRSHPRGGQCHAFLLYPTLRT